MKTIAVLASAAAALAIAAAGLGAAGHGEIWANAEDSGAIYVLRGHGAQIEKFTYSSVQRPHLITFSPSGRYAYVADVGNGLLNVVRRHDRELVASVTFPAGLDTHQAAPSPDGTTLLVSRRAGSRTIFKVSADESAEAWTLAPEALTFPVGRAPICTVFRPDGAVAYTSLAPTGGLAVVDVATMTLVPAAGVGGVIPTAGTVGCGFADAGDGRHVYALSQAGSGHLYRLDLWTAELVELNPAVGAVDAHWIAASPNGKVLYVASRGADELRLLDAETGAVVETLALDPTPAPDQPDGIAVLGNTLYVAMKAAGTVAVVDANRRTVSYMSVVGASANALPHVTARN